MSEDSKKPGGPDAKEVNRLREEYGMGKPASSAARLATSGIEFGGIIVVAIVLGLWLDSRFDTKPWIMLGLMVFGMVGAMVRLIRRVMKNGER